MPNVHVAFNDPASAQQLRELRIAKGLPGGTQCYARRQAMQACTANAIETPYGHRMSVHQPNRQGLRDAFAKLTDFTGVTGKMTFKEGSGDPVKSAVMMKIKDGKFTWVTNIDP